MMVVPWWWEKARISSSERVRLWAKPQLMPFIGSTPVIFFWQRGYTDRDFRYLKTRRRRESTAHSHSPRAPPLYIYRQERAKQTASQCGHQAHCGCRHSPRMHRYISLKLENTNRERERASERHTPRIIAPRLHRTQSTVEFTARVGALRQVKKSQKKNKRREIG